MYKFGIEYTFLTPDRLLAGHVFDSNPAWGFANRANSMAKKFGVKTFFKTKFPFFPDGHRVIESPSPIHKNFRDAKVHYKKLTKLTEQLEFKTHEEIKRKDHIETTMNGGGHVHVCIRHIHTRRRIVKNTFFKNILTASVNMPWLSWIFNQWCDDLNSNSFINHYNLTDIYTREKVWESMVFATKDFAFRCPSVYKTLEFRFFDAPESFEDVKNYVEFAQAFTKWQTKLAMSLIELKPKYSTPKQLNRLKKEKCWEEFNDFIEHTLKLNPKNYQKYKKNLDERYEYGSLV